jgi:hypothetical protein
MPRRTVLFGLLVIVVLTVTLTAAAAEIPRWKGSWADPQNIWANGADVPRDSDACQRAVEIACGTEDGGRTWHPIMRDSEPGLSHTTPLRTSATAGVLAAQQGHRFLDVDHFWTTDAGRHWHRTSLFGRGARRIVGHGRHVYWDVGARVIYRVNPWPPRHPLVCPEGWRHDLSDRNAPPDEWGAICLNPPRSAALRSAVVRRFRTLAIRDAAAIANGAAWVLVPVQKRRPLVLLIRHGRQRLIRLPRADAPRETRSLSGFEIYAAWPYINVTAIAWHRPRQRRDPIVLGCVFWESHNGGKRWDSHFEEIGGGWDEPYCNF